MSLAFPQIEYFLPRPAGFRWFDFDMVHMFDFDGYELMASIKVDDTVYVGGFPIWHDAFLMSRADKAFFQRLVEDAANKASEACWEALDFEPHMRALGELLG